MQKRLDNYESLTQHDVLRTYTALYGPTMSVDNLAECLKCSKKHIFNLIYTDGFPIPTFHIKMSGQKRGRRYCNTSEFVNYIQNQTLVDE